MASLTELQLAIMQILWTRGEASVGEVHDLLRTERIVAQQTVATLLARLVDRKVVSRRKEGRRSHYAPVLRPEQVRAEVLEDLTGLGTGLIRGGTPGIVNALLDFDEVSLDDLRQIRTMIEAREQSLRAEGQ